MSNITLNKIVEAIYEGDDILVIQLADQAVEEGTTAEDIINLGGIIGLENLGQAFEDMEAFLPELMLGGEAMHALIKHVTPLLKKEGKEEGVTVVMGCAQGDLHDIGLNLVATQLEIGGFNVINLGTDTSVKEFLETAKNNDAKIIGISSLLTTSAYYQEELIQKLVKDGIRDNYKVIVGGGPITPAWTKKIGADGYSRTATQAVALCKRVIKNAENLPIIIE